MTDVELLHAVENALGALAPFDRDLYALARLRVERGTPLKATQRQYLARVIRLAWEARGQVESARANGERGEHG